MEDNLIFRGESYWPPHILDGLISVVYNRQKYNSYTSNAINLYDSLRQSAYRHPDKCCIIDDSGSSYTFRQFLELVDDFSNILFHHYHVNKGSHVALLMYNSIEFCVSFYAIIKLRGVAIPLPTKYRKNEIFSLIEKSALCGIICDKEFYEWFHDDFDVIPYFLLKVDSGSHLYSLPKSKERQYPILTPDSEDVAVIMFTSGTTSQSKGVMMSNFNIMHALIVYERIFEISPNDKTIIPIPIYHVTGLIALLGLFIFAGGCVHLHRTFNANRVLSDVKNYSITFLHGSPTVFSLLLDYKDEYPHLPSLRILACGSANMPRKKIRALHIWLPKMKFHTVYGLTETASPATIFPDDAATSRHIGSSGYPIPGTSFKICDEKGNPMNAETIGSIYLSGTVVLSNYLNYETDTLKDGWLDTGDLGYFDKEGYLYIVDRKKDMINRGGEKIWSFDVENALYSIPGIEEAAVVGIPDEIYGEVPAALVAIEKGSILTQAQIQNMLKGKLANFQIPVKILIVDNLPFTPNSKVDKRCIRQLLLKNS